MRLLPVSCLLIQLFVSGVAVASEAVLDLVTRKEKGATSCWVVTETLDELRWRITPEPGTENKTLQREVRSVLYAFQRQSGAYAQGRYGFAAGTASGGELWMQNEAGVILRLKAKRTGLMLSLGGDAVVISMQ